MISINVCVGSACHLKGSYNVIDTFQKLIEEYDLGDQVEIKAMFCMKHCMQAVSVMIEDEFFSASGATTRRIFEEHVLPLCQKS